MGNCLRRRTSRRGRNERPQYAPEAGRVATRKVIVILPNQSQRNIWISATDRDNETKEKVLGNEAPNLDNFEVVLWLEEDNLIVMNDDDEFGDNLFLFDHIIIRERQNVDLGNQDLANAVQIR